MVKSIRRTKMLTVLRLESGLIKAYSGLILEVVSSVVTIVADYRKIVAEGNNKRQSIVSFHNRSVAENSVIF